MTTMIRKKRKMKKTNVKRKYALSPSSKIKAVGYKMSSISTYLVIIKHNP